MMRSLYTGVSGLTNHQTRMDVLSNNIANVNTIGFKASRTVFQDSLSQTMQGATAPRDNVGGVNARQIGLGVRVGSIDILFTKTSFQNTNVNTDLAINNDGFFIVNNGAQSYYTRAGNFSFDAEGNLVTNEGLHVMGWAANKVTGAINTAAPIEALKIPITSTMEPKITTTVSFSGNLMADTELGGAKSSTQDIYDAEGYAHRLSTMFTKIGDNTWLAYTNIEGVVKANPPAANEDYINGNVKVVSFDPNGKFQNVQDLTTTLSNLGSLGNFFTSSPFAGDINLNSNAATADTVTGTISFIDDTGKTHTVTITANCTAGETSPGLGDAQWELVFSGEVAPPVTQGSVSNGDDLSSITLSDGTIVNLNNLAQKINITAAPSNLNTQSTSLLSKINASGDFLVSPSPFTANVNLNANGVLGQTAESVILFTDYSGVVHALAVKAVCTKGDTTGSAGDAEWRLDFTENGQIVGSGSYSATSANTDLPTVTLSDGTAVNLNGLTEKVNVGAAATNLNTQAVTSGGNTALSYTPANTVNPMPHTVNVTYTDPQYGDITQYAGEFNLGDPYQNGYSSGTLTTKTINAAGVIVGTYSNGQQLNLGQIATCIFNNQQGLERAGSTLFTKSNNSGDPIIGEAGTGGRGTLQAGVLEMANVDLAEEFTNMIVTQRGYQSNSRIITTSDELLQELMNLKR